MNRDPNEVERPDPNTVPSAEWFMKQLASEGDNAGSDFNDGDTIQGYFGWDSVTVRHASEGNVLRHELKVWWEPSELGNKRHVRRFRVFEIGTEGETVTV